jgi:hypothetical protein
MLSDSTLRMEAVCHNPEAHISKERKYLKFVIE